MILALFFLITILLATMPAYAVDYYFAASGNDSNNCSIGSPCRNISKAGSLSLNAGDNVFFNRGDTFTDTSGNGFDLDIADSNDSSGTSGNPIGISAYGSGNRPIIQKSGNGYGIIIKSLDYYNISDIHFIGYQFGIEIRGGQNITIDNLIIQDTRNACLAVKSDGANSNRISDNVSITNNEISGCGDGTQQGEGLYVGDNSSSLTNRNILIENNYLHDIGWECIEIKQGTDPTIEIYRNTLENCNDENTSPDCGGSCPSGVGIVATGSSSNDNDAQISYNWIKNTVGNYEKQGTSQPFTTGSGISWNRQGMDFTYNVVANNQSVGVILRTTGSPNFPMIVSHNTIYNNGLECIRNFTSNTPINNSCWANQSGNNASNPLYANAAANDFNPLPGSPLLNAASDAGHVGALQPFIWTSAIVQSPRTDLLITGTVSDLFEPISSCTASSFTINCSMSGSQVASTCTPTSTKSATLVFGTAIPTGESCTLAALYGAAEDSANIGGALAPSPGPLNGRSQSSPSLLVTSGAGVNLLTAANVSSTTGTFAAGRGIENSYDGDVITDEGTSVGDDTQYTVTHDLASAKNINFVRIWGDASGNKQCTNFDIEYSANCTDYTTHSSSNNCNGNQWFQVGMGGQSLQCLRWTINGPAGGTQWYELEAYEQTGTPIQSPPRFLGVSITGVNIK